MTLRGRVCPAGLGLSGDPESAFLLADEEEVACGPRSVESMGVTSSSFFTEGTRAESAAAASEVIVSLMMLSALIVLRDLLLCCLSHKRCRHRVQRTVKFNVKGCFIEVKMTNTFSVMKRMSYCRPDDGITQKIARGEQGGVYLLYLDNYFPSSCLFYENSWWAVCRCANALGSIYFYFFPGIC